MTSMRIKCITALLLTLLLPLTIEAQRRKPSAQIVKIRVRDGETVATLADRYNVAAEEIAGLNGIERDAQLQPGTEILMPSTSSPANPSRRVPTPQALNNSLRARAALYEPYIGAAARRYGVDPRALWTIAFLETRFQPNQISPKGARGLMQFMPETAATYRLSNPFDPVAAIDAAARYVRDLSLRFDNRLDLILAGYNSGEGTVEAYLKGISIQQANGRIINPRRLQTGGIPPFQETRNYVAQGLAAARYIHAAGIFSASEFVACRYPAAQPTSPATPSTIARVDEEAANSDDIEPNAPSSVYASALIATPVAPSPSNASVTQKVVNPQQSDAGNALQMPTSPQPRSSYASTRGGF